MATPNLHLVDDNGQQLGDNLVGVVSRVADSVFRRYWFCDPAEISDVLEESARVVDREMRNGRRLADVRGFFWRTAINRVIAKLRSRRREKRVGQRTIEGRADNRVTASTLENAIAMREAFAWLSEREQTVLLMKLQDYSAKEICRMLNVSSGNVDNTAWRAREKLHKVLTGSAPPVPPVAKNPG
jgi:RNA polymerase sigma factor (sigma-70 family)